jgi:hypothetical protein
MRRSGEPISVPKGLKLECVNKVHVHTFSRFENSAVREQTARDVAGNSQPSAIDELFGSRDQIVDIFVGAVGGGEFIGRY